MKIPSRFERRIILALAVIALIPLGAAALLQGAVLDAARAETAFEGQQRREAIERAGQAYAALFAEKKARLRERAHEIAAGAPADPAGRVRYLTERVERDGSLKQVRVTPLGPPAEAREITTHRVLSDEDYRELHVDEDLPGARLELTFVTPRAPFREFEALSALAASEGALPSVRSRLDEVLRAVLLGGLALVIVAATAVGWRIARRVTRRVSALSAATRRVASGDLAARVGDLGGDEIGDLGRSFDEMVGELSAGRERIAWLERIGAWQDVARRLAHEIKNPLTPIQLAVQQLGRSHVARPGDPDNERYRRTLDEATRIVSEEIAGLRRLVDEFTAFSRLPRAERVPLDARAVARDLVSANSGEGGPFQGRVELGAPEGEGEGEVPIRGDRMLLQRALQNLIGNALEAGASRVRVEVGTGPGGVGARITVSDDGPGVRVDLAERIFDPYVTTKEHGTGLGLPIVKKIVLEHGGEVRLESRPGGGARFVITLPE